MSRLRSLMLGLVAVAVLTPGLAVAGDSCRTDRVFRNIDRGVHKMRRALRRHGERVREHTLRGHRYRTLTCGCVEVHQPVHYKKVKRRVRERGCYQRVWIAPVYERDLCGRRVLVQSGRYKRVWTPGRIVFKYERVRVPARWIRDRGCRHHG